MEFKTDFEKIKNDLKQEDTNKGAEAQKDDLQSKEIAPINKKLPTTFEDAKNQALAEFKPKYDTSKSIYDNGKDIVRTLGLNEAIKDDKFINKVAEGAKKEIETDIDTDQKDAEIKNQNAFYKKHKPVLMFARMKEPCGLALMKWTYGFAVVPYIISLIIGGIFNLIAMLFESINSLFNSIMGIPEYMTDKNGDIVKDSQGNPIPKNIKVNLLTKIVFWALFAIICLVIVFAVVKGITGFDVIQSIKNLING